MTRWLPLAALLLAGSFGPAATAQAGVSNGLIAFELVEEEQTCDQCGPNGESETFRGGARTWLIRPDGSQRSRLRCTGVAGGCYDVAFNADGRRLAAGGRGGLVVMRSDGSRPRVVVAEPAAGWSPAWGPGGRRLAFGAVLDPLGDRTLSVAVTDLAGNVRPLYDAFARDIAWSRRGPIAWTEWNRRPDVWIGDARGRPRKRIATGGYDLAWSPSGARLAILGRRSLRLVDADGGRPRVLTRRCGLGWEDEGGLAWSPDGREIACRSVRGSLIVLDLTTMTVRTLWRRLYARSVNAISWQPRPER